MIFVVCEPEAQVFRIESEANVLVFEAEGDVHGE